MTPDQNPPVDPQALALSVSAALAAAAETKVLPRLEYQSRYVAYAYAHGETPEAMLTHDDKTYPGGCMAGFLCWIPEQWREWDKLTGHKGAHSIQDHAEFDAWLSSRFPTPIAPIPVEPVPHTAPEICKCKHAKSAHVYHGTGCMICPPCTEYEPAIAKTIGELSEAELDELAVKSEPAFQAKMDAIFRPQAPKPSPGQHMIAFEAWWNEKRRPIGIKEIAQTAWMASRNALPGQLSAPQAPEGTSPSMWMADSRPLLAENEKFSADRDAADKSLKAFIHLEMDARKERDAARAQVSTLIDETESLRAQLDAAQARVSLLTEAVTGLKDALQNMVSVVNSAGSRNLANGVQLGQTSWLIKMNDALDYARAALESPAIAALTNGGKA